VRTATLKRDLETLIALTFLQYTYVINELDIVKKNPKDGKLPDLISQIFNTSDDHFASVLEPIAHMLL